jgi:hypothetical protein
VLHSRQLVLGHNAHPPGHVLRDNRSQMVAEPCYYKANTLLQREPLRDTFMKNPLWCVWAGTDRMNVMGFR